MDCLKGTTFAKRTKSSGSEPSKRMKSLHIMELSRDAGTVAKQTVILKTLVFKIQKAYDDHADGTCVDPDRLCILLKTTSAICHELEGTHSQAKIIELLEHLRGQFHLEDQGFSKPDQLLIQQDDIPQDNALATECTIIPIAKKESSQDSCRPASRLLQPKQGVSMSKHLDLKVEKVDIRGRRKPFIPKVSGEQALKNDLVVRTSKISAFPTALVSARRVPVTDSSESEREIAKLNLSSLLKDSKSERKTRDPIMTSTIISRQKITKTPPDESSYPLRKDTVDHVKDSHTPRFSWKKKGVSQARWQQTT